MSSKTSFILSFYLIPVVICLMVSGPIKIVIGICAIGILGAFSFISVMPRTLMGITHITIFLIALGKNFL